MNILRIIWIINNSAFYIESNKSCYKTASFCEKRGCILSFISERQYMDTVSYIITSLSFYYPFTTPASFLRKSFITGTLTEKELHHRNSLMTFAKRFRAAILQNICEQLHSFQRSQVSFHEVLLTQVLISNSQHRQEFLRNLILLLSWISALHFLSM